MDETPRTARFGIHRGNGPQLRGHVPPAIRLGNGRLVARRRGDTKVADNPIFEASLQSTRQGQKDTYNRYMAAGGVLPSDVEANQVDRIHAYILWQCEQRYGPRFWPDFFAQARAQQAALAQAVNAPGGDDGVRDLRYQLSVDCFDRLPGLGFKELLQSSHISLTHDVRTLRPTEPGWNRRLQ